MSGSVTPSTKESRSLEFKDGSSNKFWKIELDGSSHTVQFGKVGTNGQTQTKSFDSDAEAKKSYDKLVAEKTKKGYVDVVSSGSTSASPAPAKPATSRPAAPTPAQTPPPIEPSPSDSPAIAAVGEVAAAAPASPTDADVRVTHEIDLCPKDWLRCPFRPRPPRVRRTPRPFDREACLERLVTLKTPAYSWAPPWHDLKLPADLSREEAHFWLTATTTTHLRVRQGSMHEVRRILAEREYDGRVTPADVRNLILPMQVQLPDEAILAIANLLTPAEYYELMIERPMTADRWAEHNLDRLVEGFNDHVLPYLTDEERQQVLQSLWKTWEPDQVLMQYQEQFRAEYYVAAALSAADAVYEVTSRWKDGKYRGDPCYNTRPQEIVFGLGSPERIASEWRRLGLSMRNADDVRTFLACTEFSALDCVADSILRAFNKDHCEGLLKILALVRAPEAALPMLQCKLSAKTPAVAREWLDKYVGNAIAGLIETANGKGNLADAALDYFRGLRQKGFAALIAERLKEAGHSDGSSRIETEVLHAEVKTYVPFDGSSTPEWLSSELKAVGKLKPKSLPSWATPAGLPPLVVGDRQLNNDQMTIVLQLLAATPVGTKHPLFTALREHVSKQSRDDFAWRMFQLWKDDGFPSKEKWAMGTIGHLGDDGCVLKLTPMIRVWPGESQHARAVFGLECLRAIGTSVSLMQLSGIAQKLKFKGLKSKAEQFVGEIAKERGLTREELEDRVVPDCGLDENGRREFSFGPRSFSFVLSSDLKPMVRDAAGKLRPNLPDPNAKDDEAKAAEAVAEWKLLKKQIKEVAAIQASRLEQAVITGRRWKAEDFESLLVRHPLMTHLAQKLIWAGFDPEGKRVSTFRVTEERDYADSDDTSLKLTGVETGVVHPLELSEAERARWGQVLGDYEIVPPFPQLGRPVYTLKSGEGDKTDLCELERYRGLKLVAPTLVFTLEKLGWIRGPAMDAGSFDEHSKYFPAADVTAVVGYEGSVGMGYISPDELLTIELVRFVAGRREPSWGRWNHKSERVLKLGDAPAIVLSEVLADVQVLKSKAK